MNLEKEIDTLNKKLAKDKSDLSKAEGSIETLMKRLKEEEGIDTLEEADAVARELIGKINLLQEDIRDKIEKVEAIYNDQD